MFTGIVEKTAGIRLLESSQNSSRMVLPIEWNGIEIGESIAVNGVCLTVCEKQDNGIHFDISPETLERTHLGRLQPGDTVNLERALQASSRLSGHWVQGHCDDTGTITEIEPIEDCFRLRIELAEGLLKYCVLKGSIAVDGVSLTINEIQNKKLSFMILPHTWKATRFQHYRVGDVVNIEVDMMAKYAEKLCQHYKQH